jgi:HD-like signal output (HDOD) protein
MNAKVLEAIKRSAAVPSMPQVVTRFIEIIQDPNFDYGEVIKVLSADPGTVSEILRLSNSALFGVRQKIVSLRQALTLLGPKRTRSLLLGRYLVDSVSRRHPSGLDMTYFWRRSLTASVLSSRFADAVLPKDRDEVFIAALLADIGIPILAEAFPQQYAPIISGYSPRGKYVTADDERAAVEATHSEVSAMVLTHWTLPDVVSTAVNLHQSDQPGEGTAATMARILNSSDRISRLLCEVPDLNEVPDVCTKAIEILRVDVGVLVRILGTVEKDIGELASALRIDVIPSNVYAILAKTIQEKLCPAPAA